MLRMSVSDPGVNKLLGNTSTKTERYLPSSSEFTEAGGYAVLVCPAANTAWLTGMEL